jgi:hypothetical protein
MEKPLNMAIEMVDLPIEKWWFSIVVLVYQRVLIGIEPLSSMVHEFLKWMFPKMDP